MQFFVSPVKFQKVKLRGFDTTATQSTHTSQSPSVPAVHCFGPACAAASCWSRATRAASRRASWYASSSRLSTSSSSASCEKGQGF